MAKRGLEPLLRLYITEQPVGTTVWLDQIRREFPDWKASSSISGCMTKFTKEGLVKKLGIGAWQTLVHEEPITDKNVQYENKTNSVHLHDWFEVRGALVLVLQINGGWVHQVVDDTNLVKKGKGE